MIIVGVVTMKLCSTTSGGTRSDARAKEKVIDPLDRKFDAAHVELRQQFNMGWPF